MRKPLIIGTLLILVFTILFFYYRLPVRDPNVQIVRKILKDFDKTGWRQRDEILEKILHDERLLQDRKIKGPLIEVFAKETVVQREREKRFYLRGELPSEDGEAYGEYYIDLLDAASKLKDPAVIPFLVSSLEYGPAVARSLATFGDMAVPPLLEKCKNGNDHERWWCLKALVPFYKETSSLELKTKIKKRIIQALQDSSERIQERAKEVFKEIK